MKSLLLIIFIVDAVVGMAIYSQYLPQFNAWKLQYKKTYKTPLDEVNYLQFEKIVKKYFEILHRQLLLNIL